MFDYEFSISKINSQHVVVIHINYFLNLFAPHSVNFTDKVGYYNTSVLWILFFDLVDQILIKTCDLLRF